MATTRTAAARDTEVERFTDEERAAMQERAREVQATRARRSGAQDTDPEADLLAKVAEMTGTDQVVAARLHELVRRHAPGLEPRTWYGMPAYAKDGKVLAYFQPAAKFKARYGMLAFNDGAALDDGQMWPVGFAITELTDEVEARIVELVTRAAG